MSDSVGNITLAGEIRCWGWVVPAGGGWMRLRLPVEEKRRMLVLVTAKSAALDEHGDLSRARETYAGLSERNHQPTTPARPDRAAACTRLRESIRPIRSHLRSQRIFRSLRSPVRERDRTCVFGSRDRLTLLAATAASFLLWSWRGASTDASPLKRAPTNAKCGVFFFSAANRPRSEDPANQSRSRACTTSTPFLTAPANPNRKARPPHPSAR